MKVKRKNLVNQLESVKKGLTAKETIQQSDCFVFKNGYVYTFNDEIFASCKIDLDFEGAVKADALLKLLNKLTDETIEVDIEDDELKINGKKFKTGIKLESEILLPTDEIEIPEDFEDAPAQFSRLAKLACHTARKSTDLSLLTCVHFADDKIESCDNDRITISTLEKEFDWNVLIPAQNLSTIVTEQIKAIAVDESWIHFKTDEDVILSCRLFSNEDEEYVDLTSQIPKKKGKLIELSSGIEEILNRAKIFGKDEESDSPLVHIAMKSTKLIVSAYNELGWYKETVKTRSKDNISFSINADFLHDIAKRGSEISIVNDTLMFTDDSSIHLVKLEQ